MVAYKVPVMLLRHLPSSVATSQSDLTHVLHTTQLDSVNLSDHMLQAGSGQPLACTMLDCSHQQANSHAAHSTGTGIKSKALAAIAPQQVLQTEPAAEWTVIQGAAGLQVLLPLGRYVIYGE
jgi:hypothetical protein